MFEPFDGEREFSLQEKSELFFTDYNMAALFVQENYPKARPRHARYVRIMIGGWVGWMSLDTNIKRSTEGVNAIFRSRYKR